MTTSIAKQKIVIFALLCFLSGFQLFQTSPQLSNACSSDPYIFAVEPGIPPFTMQSKMSNSIEGYGIDSIDWISENTQIDLTYKQMTWNYILESLANNTVDFTYMIISPERQLNYSFTLPVFNFSTRVFVSSNNKIISSITDLEEKSVAVVKNSIYEQYLNDSLVNPFIVQCNSEEEAIQKLYNEEVQAAYVGEDSGLYTIQNNQYENLKIVGDPIILGELGIATLKEKHQSILSSFNSTILEGYAADIFTKFREEYLGKSIAIGMKPKFWTIFSIIGISVVVIIGSMILWNRTLNKKLQEYDTSLSRQKEKLDIILKNSHDFIVMINNEGEVEYANPAAIAIIGKLGGLKGECLFDHLHIHSNDSSQILMFNPKTDSLEDLKKKIPHMVVLTNEKNEQRFFLSIFSIIESKDKYRNKLKNQALLVCREITTQQNTYLEELRQQKIESLGVLAGGIAHDFNNLLTGIMGNLSLITMEEPDNPNVAELVKEAIQASKRAKDLTFQLLTFSKGGTPIKALQRIEPILYEAATFALRGSRYRVNFHIEPDLWLVNIDSGQISQVMNNLLINAIQAMKSQKNTEIIISASNYKKEDSDAFLVDGTYIKIAVTDFGVGISEDNIIKIFDPYFTTKTTGNGLGLAVTHSIIQKHNGNITATSEISKQTEFTFYLPSFQFDTSETPLKDELTENQVSVGKKILVLEDEEVVYKILERMLKNLGYVPTFTTRGEETIKEYQNHQDRGESFDIVILDLTIQGGMGGEETLRNLREINPSIKAIVSSGYANEQIMSDFVKFGFAGVLTKPFDIDDLRTNLQKWCS